MARHALHVMKGNMDVNCLNTFLAVARHSNFTKAAARMGLSQPTVTARIKKLERSLGTDLFRRNGGGAELTGSGNRFQRYARSIVGLAESAEQSVRDDTGIEEQLQISADPSLLSHRMLTLAEYMHLRHPDVDLGLQALTGDPAAALRTGQADCVYFIGERLAVPHVKETLLCPEPLVLVGHADHPLAGTRRVSDQQLRGAELVCAQRTMPYQRLFEEFMETGDGGTPPTLALGTVDAAARALDDGFRLALLPRIEVAEQLATGKLRAIDWAPPFSVFSQIAWQSGLEAVRDFEDLLSASVRVVSEQLVDHQAVPGPPEQAGHRAPPDRPGRGKRHAP